jgi:hypothetical protein
VAHPVQLVLPVLRHGQCFVPPRNFDISTSSRVRRPKTSTYRERGEATPAKYGRLNLDRAKPDRVACAAFMISRAHLQAPPPQLSPR